MPELCIQNRSKQDVRLGRTACAVGVVALASLLLPVATGAQEAEKSIFVDPRVEETTTLPPLERRDDSVVLTLNEAIAIALERNLGLRVERYNLEEADYRVLGNRGIYDFGTRANVGGFGENSPAASRVAPPY